MDSNNKVSQTAMLIASLRALACYEDDPQVHGNDHHPFWTREQKIR